MVSDGTLIEALADDLIGALVTTNDGARRSVILLLDPDRQFSRLIPDLETELAGRAVALVTLSGLGEQLTTKMTLIRQEPEGERAVVYGPGIAPDALLPKANGAAPDLWGLVDYRYKGIIWDGTDRAVAGALPSPASLDRWLERRGASFGPGTARPKLASGGPDSRLARLAARRAHGRLDQWPRPLTEAAVRDELAGDPRESVIQLLLDPSEAVGIWGDDRDDVLERVGTTYGLRFEGTDPERIADEAATSVALTDAWDVFGRLDDFPFTARLPRGPQQRERVLTLLRTDLIHRADVLARLRARIALLEPDLAAIETWAADKPGVPAALPHLLEARVRRLLDQLEAAWVDGPAACLEVLDGDLATSAVPEEAHATLSVLHRLRQLAKLAREARAETGSIATASKLVARYSTEWWRIDATYLSIVAACREDPELATASALASRLYFEYVDAANERFSGLIEAEGSWPPTGTNSILGVVSKVWAHAASRQAVLIIDALRFDLARQVADALGPSAAVEPVMTTLPSTTPFGMTALMPLIAGEPAVSYDQGKLSIGAGGRSDLQDRSGRKAYLASFLAARDSAETVAFVELEALVQGEAIPKARWLVVFSYALDDRGHSLADSASLPGEAVKLVPRLVRAVERLHRAGVARVDVVTDHGFLFVPPELIDSLGHPDLPAKQSVSKNARYAVLQPDVAATDVFRLASPMAEEVSLGFPRGIRTLLKATDYLHGGISLQESVIGRLTSQASLVAPRVDVVIELTVSKVTGATIPVRVRPAAGPASGQMTLGAPRPIKIRFSVDAALDANAADIVDVADPITLELRADTPELVSALFLRPGISLKAGITLTVRAQDDETGEGLLTKQVPLVVDWEG